MLRVRSVLFLGVIASLIAIPASAVAANGCRIMVTNDGAPVANAKVEAMDADKVVLMPQKTSDMGRAEFTEGLNPLYVMINGMEAGRCSGQLVVDLVKLKEDHNSQPAGASGATPDGEDDKPDDNNDAGQTNGSGNTDATDAAEEEKKKETKKKKKKTGGK